MLKEGLQGVVAPNGLGTPAWGDRETCPGSGRYSRRACGGHQFSTAHAHQLGGTGSPAQSLVGARGGFGVGSSSQWPVHTSLEGRGVLPRRWPVLKEGLLGALAPNSPGTLAWGDRESHPGCVRCSRGACGGQ